MEDRKYERIPLIAEIILDSSAGRRPSRISDLSMGGCYIESITSFREGDLLAFDLIHADGQSLRFTGNVAYVLEGMGFGLTFTNMGPQQVEFIQRSMPAGTVAQPKPENSILEVW